MDGVWEFELDEQGDASREKVFLTKPANAATISVPGAWQVQGFDEARFLALNIVKDGEFAVVYGVRGESQGHLIAARSDSLPVDLRKLVPVIGSILPCKGGGGPSLVELVTPEKAQLQEAVETAVDWLRINEEKLKA